MAHTAPARTGPRTTHHPTIPLRANLLLPALAGIVYGLWTSGIARHAGPITGWNVLLGVISALAFAAAAHGIHTIAPRLPRELRAATWAAFAGIAFGFVYSLTDAGIVKTVGLSLVITAGVFAVVFYRYYTTED
ncbi:hypothetical protein C6Y14_19095 [Streptomyces dioscori]|uniref:Integral membrane protein n=1 Tax=Streptomyces dioscori TaxID=2109333 RepID=A0A2P8Q6G4_9ACTN|nr:hypothetical protein [Streptomyces dioscori]PSM41833.1 hypothetical protein C6Y14_19095 [Streptomyces dioscori]